MPDATTETTTAATTTAATETAATTAAAETAAATTAATESTTTETTAATTTEAAAETKYDLKLPADSTLDAAIVDRTAAIARELGLTNDAAQKLLDETVKDLAERDTAATAAQNALLEAWKPGGAEFVKRDEAWRAEALADPTIAGGSPEKLAKTIEQAQQALNKYGPELKDYLNETGLGSHPAAIKFLANIGKAMGEGKMVMPGAEAGGTSEQDLLNRMYPTHAAKA